MGGTGELRGGTGKAGWSLEFVVVVVVGVVGRKERDDDGERMRDDEEREERGYKHQGWQHYNKSRRTSSGW